MTQDVKKDISGNSILAAFRLIKVATTKTIENDELKAFSPNAETLSEYSDTTTNMTLNMIRNKLNLN